jgi:hypothetical protein
MKRSLLFCLLSLLALTAKAADIPKGEWIILVGGPSLKEWEQYKAQPHDHWWANFVHAARLRTEQLREGLPPDAPITWLVYKQGYIDRAQQEHQDLISYIESVRDKFHLNLVWFRNGDDVINYLNNGQPRNRLKVAGFEYFGHSNRACFMFDYSSNLDSASKSWLHETQLKAIQPRIFARSAYIQSWGCHTGEEMNGYWYRATNTHMVGALGKTQFMMEELPVLTSPGGKWVSMPVSTN